MKDYLLSASTSLSTNAAREDDTMATYSRTWRPNRETSRNPPSFRVGKILVSREHMPIVEMHKATARVGMGIA